MNKKEIFQKYFDQAAQAVIAQGKMSIRATGNGGTECVYRSYDGLKCAVGHIIPDEDMAKFLISEGQTPSQFPESFYDKYFPGVDGSEASYFLEKLQDAHDYCRCIGFVKEFTSRMNDIAAHFGLRGL